MNGCQQGFRSLASFSFGGQESASKPPQAICKPLGQIVKYEMNLNRLKNLTLLSLLLLIGCTPEESLLHYKFGQNTITRLNKEKKVYLYDGAYSLEGIESQQASAVIDWQFDDGLFWFIQFQPDDTVLLFSGGLGRLESINKKGSKLVYSKETNDLLEPYQSDSSSYNNLYQLSNNLQLEKERNEKFGSKVRREPIRVSQ
ncbi:hypothetical protein ACSX1A_11380 [Pontibacter sp. MBLB2868]|uniref:hypothetical protein n=1 Tax=Pontibacter sp. MBLB2868 TaxID=3451555 RepID=UPI003F7524CC